MKPAPFIYHAPERLDELLDLLAADDADGRVIAGGQSLVPMMNFRLSTPERLLDIRRVEQLRGLRRLPDGGLVVGAAVTQAQLLRDRAVTADFPLLAEGIGHIGHPQIRSRGTICGSLAHHDPTAELPALALALDARMTILSAGCAAREMPAADFFVSYYETALEHGELLAEVTFPAPRPRAGWSFRELARRRGDFALVGAVALVERGAASRLVLFGIGDRAARIEPVERLLDAASAPGGSSAPALDAQLLAQVPELVAESIDPLGDIHASAEYRRELAGELAVAAIAEAIERAA
jgi:carbon-monoxide dehydrogenase medium subunit